MKQIFVCLFMMLTLGCFASQSSYFELNEDALNAEFSELNTLENAVLINPEMTTSQAVEMNLMSMAQSTTSSESGAEGSFSFEIEGFLWGFLCCPVGLFTVAVNNNKSQDTKLSYWIGVGAAVVISTIVTVTSSAAVFGI